MIRSFAKLEVDSIDSGSILTNSIVSITGINATQLQGVNISTIAPVGTQILTYNSGTTQWEPINQTDEIPRTNGTYTLWVDNVTGNDLTGNGSSGLPYLTIAKAITVFETVSYDIFHLMLVNTGVDYTYSETRTSQTVGGNTFTEFADFTSLDNKCSRLIIEGYSVPETFTWASNVAFLPGGVDPGGPTWVTLSTFGGPLSATPDYIKDTTTGRSYAVYPTGSSTTSLNVIIGNVQPGASGTGECWQGSDIVTLNNGVIPLYLTGASTIEFRQMNLPTGFGLIGNDVAFRNCRVNLNNCYQAFDYLDIQGCQIGSSTTTKLTSGSLESFLTISSSTFSNSSNLQISGYYSDTAVTISKCSNISLFNGSTILPTTVSNCAGLNVNSCYFTAGASLIPLTIERSSAVLLNSSRFISDGEGSAFSCISISNSQVETNAINVTITDVSSSADAAIKIFCSVVNVIATRVTTLGRRLFSIDGGSVVTWVSSSGTISTDATFLVTITNCSKLIYSAATSLSTPSYIFDLTKNSSLISTVGTLSNIGLGIDVLKLGANAIKGWVASNDASYNNLSLGNLAFTYATDEYCTVLG